MLVSPELKRVVDFHGHLCPDLAIGIKLCEFVRQILGNNEDNLFVVAENSTSAVDAIQMLLGTTLGNQHLFIMDKGKHNYSIYFNKKREAIKFLLKPLIFGDEEEFSNLEKSILKNWATLDDVVRYQELLDNRIITILNLHPKEIFKTQNIVWEDHLKEFSSMYVKCEMCNEVVIESKSIKHKGKVYCISCFKKYCIPISFQ